MCVSAPICDRMCCTLQFICLLFKLKLKLLLPDIKKKKYKRKEKLVVGSTSVPSYNNIIIIY